MIQLIEDDCMWFMAAQEDLSFDIAIADPPYFKGPNQSGYFGGGYSSIGVKRSAHHDSTFHWDIPTPEYFKELKRVSKNQIIWGANHFAGMFDSSSPAWIIWDKDNGSSSFADAELAYTSFDTAARIFKYRWNGMLQGNIGNKKLNEKRINPTQKPVCLYSWQLENYAEKGMRILDTHHGSGSLAIACHYFGADFVGIDKDPDQVKGAQERFDNHTRQISISQYMEAQ